MKRSFLIGLLIFVVGSMSAMDFELLCLEKTDLAQNIARQLGKPLHQPLFQTFADGELNVVLSSTDQFAQKTAVIIQSTGHPVNKNVLGVSFLAHELKNAGAQKIIAVIPYFGYGRQEKSTLAGKPGHAKVVAQLLESAGIDEIIAVELHDLALIDLFTIPVHNISVHQTIAHDIATRLKLLEAICVIAPDQGARAYVDAIGDKLGVATKTFTKERYGKDKTRVVGQEGEDSLADVGVMVDDIISTGGTAINACEALHDQGFNTMYGYFVHPVLARNAIERVASSHFAKIFVGNTIPLSPEAQEADFIEQFDVSEAIISKLKEVVYEVPLPHITTGVRNVHL